jgi:hypothetical protein
MAAFRNFEEFWAALDRLDLAIARMQELQQQTAERLTGNAKRRTPDAPEQEGCTPNLDQLEVTMAALGAMIAKLVTTNAANERRLRNRTS